MTTGKNDRWRARQRMTAASAIAARPQAEVSAADVQTLIAWLDDLSYDSWGSNPSFDGDSESHQSYVAEAAISALAQVAPHAAVDRVALAVARLASCPSRIQYYNYTSPLEVPALLTPAQVEVFGPALEAELRRLVADGPDDLRAGAAAVIALIDDERAKVALEIRKLTAGDASSRVHACRTLGREHGKRGVAAVPALIAALDDDAADHRTEQRDGAVTERDFFVSESAVHALGVVAPGVATDRIARTMIRLQDRVWSTTRYPGGTVREVRIRWTSQMVTSHGVALLDAVRAVISEGPDELRAGAAAVLATLLEPPTRRP